MPDEKIYTEDEIKQFEDTVRFRMDIHHSIGGIKNSIEDIQVTMKAMQDKCNKRPSVCFTFAKEYVDEKIRWIIGVPATLSVVFLVVINWNKVLMLVKGS